MRPNIKKFYSTIFLCFTVLFGIVVPAIGLAAAKEIPVTDPVKTGITAVTEKGAAPNTSASHAKGNSEKSLANEPSPRGQLLYENHCHRCHESLVHIREAHKAKTYEDVQYWVGRWAQELDVKWSADEIDSVVQYLNNMYYHY